MQRECCVKVDGEVAVSAGGSIRHEIRLLSKLDHVEDGKGECEVAKYLYARPLGDGRRYMGDEMKRDIDWGRRAYVL